MGPSDFGIDVDALPKLVLNEDAGRAMLGRLNKVESFRKAVNIGKRVHLIHILADHLQAISDEKFKSLTTGMFLKRTDELIHDHELVWTQVSRLVDRHVFLFVTAYASVPDNILDEDDTDLVCGAYTNTFFEAMCASISAMELADALIVRLNNSYDKSDNLADIVDARKQVERDAGRYRVVLSRFVADAVGSKEYRETALKKRR